MTGLTPDQFAALDQLTETADPVTLHRLATLLGVPTGGDDKPRWIARTQEEVAEFFGVSHGTVRKEWVSGGMPGTRGSYDLADIYRWKISRERDPGQSRRESQAAMDSERAKLLALKRAKEEGRLIDRDEVERAFREWFVRIRLRLSASMVDVVTRRAPAEQQATAKRDAEADLAATITEILQTEVLESDIESMILSEAERIHERRAAVERSSRTVPIEPAEVSDGGLGT